VALLFLQGWRVSEVLGLAWEDVDLDACTALVRRASVYVDGAGQRLGPPKTEGAHGKHFLMPTVVALLKRRRDMQADDRATAPRWETHLYEGEAVSIIFTTPTGGLVLRQTIAKLVKEAARTADIQAVQSKEARFATHSGRRTVVTSMFVEGDEALEDIAQFVGHARAATTAGYVKRLGRRPQAVAERAATLMDPHHRNSEPEGADDAQVQPGEPAVTAPSAGGSESPTPLASNRESDAPERLPEQTYEDGR
jgi:integrase